MTEVVDTDKVLEALSKENVIWKQRVEDLMSRVIRIEKVLIEISNKVFPIPNEMIIKK